MGSPSFHKMLNNSVMLRRFADRFGKVVGVVVIGWLALAAFTWNKEAVFFGDGVYFVDGDCYSRLTRVRMIEEEGLQSIRHHAWENFPEGTSPHTTMPMDALIAGMASMTDQNLELAAVWVSPVLGLVTVGFLVAWGLAGRLPYWWATGWLAAVSPILAHGFQLGRPDHQSLLVLLIAVAISAELRIWNNGREAWKYVSAVAWGVALWVSLFEPAVLLGAVLVARGTRRVMARKTAVETETLPYHYGVLAGVLAVAFLVDGWRAGGFHEAFGRWALQIGELRSAGWRGIFSWCGWLVLVAPVLLVWRAFRGGGAVCGLLAGLIVLLAGLCFWHARWGYFLALVFAMSLPWALAVFRRRWLAVAVLLASVWPVAREWEVILYPDDQALRARVENVADAVALREAALAIQNLPGGAVLAPWWFSPAIVWWSGQPCVGGTSHQSLPGIVDSCRFYLESDEAVAMQILRRRQVRYVVAYEPKRVVANAEQILGEKTTGVPLAERLYKNSPPPGMERVFENRFFKVYRVAD